jgi:hypothetical protein
MLLLYQRASIPRTKNIVVSMNSITIHKKVYFGHFHFLIALLQPFFKPVPELWRLENASLAGL